MWYVLERITRGYGGTPLLDIDVDTALRKLGLLVATVICILEKFLVFILFEINEQNVGR
jgi:hypothetical protein